MAAFIKSDLEFILDQIIIAERDAAGESLNDLLPNTEVSFGLRTVTGAFNNLAAGRSTFGAADTTFPRLLTPIFNPAEGVPSGFFGPGSPAILASSYLQSSGFVFDSQPRVISNLIVDQTAGNPAAVAAAAESGSQVVTGAGIDGVIGTADDTHSFFIPNVAPDEGLSAPFNSWMTFFGQFFDHGLDLVTKGGSGTIFIPLQPDDPLYVPGGNTNFMVVTRATNQRGPDGLLGTADDIHENENTTSPFVDQNQTYSSHPSHQVFLRAYEINAAGDPVATGKLITNRNLGADGKFGTVDDVEIGGMATWAVVKAQARDILGINLTDADVGNIPLLATDAYGNFIPGPNGFPQVVMKGPDGLGGTGDDVLVEGNPAAPIDITNAVRTGHQFLIDIAHNAVPVFSGGVLAPDADGVAGNAVAVGAQGNNLEYDNELLDAHYIAGDGRVNENIGLTAVHHVFHSEHNRLVEHTKDVILASGDPVFIAKWQLPDGSWDGERLFQAAKFGTEMQYQHLVFEEFARTIQPNVDAFLDFDDTIDPAIVAEFAHAVYRFGHSMLTETIDRLSPTYVSSEIGLIEAFLNPLAFASSGLTPDAAAGAIIRGVTRQVGNEIDEFVTDALRNNLVGLPLDLAAINLARGRDTGIPTLNEARRTFYDGTGDSQLKPYTSWADFVQHMKHPESLINFIAAYGTHTSITSATTLDGKRAAATAIVLGGVGEPVDRLDFLMSSGAWASGANGVTITGLDNVDLWIGGLAEEKMPFGGMLGSTFNFVFETQMEALQNGDRFYYLHRTAGLNFLAELENNSFAKLVELNTGVTHLPGLIFSTPGFTLEVDQTKQFNASVIAGPDGIVADNPLTLVDESADNQPGNADPIGDHILVPLVSRDNPATVGPDTNYLKYTGDQHVVLGGTAGNDILISSEGDDTLYGDGGNDRLEGGYGNDDIQGGDGDDILSDAGGDDVLKGGAGNDVIHGGNGLNLIIAGPGSDFIVTGEDSSEVFAGEGNDFILGSKLNVQMAGNEGNDWIEIGTQDGAPGDNFDPFGNDAITGHDVFVGDGSFDEMIGEGGDDIMVGSSGPDKMKGMSGFDWATYQNERFGVSADMLGDAFNEAPVPISAAGVMTLFAQMEGLSGSAHSDVLRGDNATAEVIATAGARGSVLTNLDLINGLRTFLGSAAFGVDGLGSTLDDQFGSGNIILGGNGSDIIEGRGGDDVIDGDAWLNVRISVRDPLDHNVQIDTAGSLKDLVPRMMSGEINPSQLEIVREILPGSGGFNFDTAVFSDLLINYDIEGQVGLLAGSDVDGDGFITIRHLVPGDPTGAEVGVDGVDKIRNIERLQFADQSAILVDGLNSEAVGAATLSNATPASWQVLTASVAGVTDADNAASGGAITGPVSFFWQVELVPGSTLFQDILAADGVTTVSGRNFTVTPELEGLSIRVRAVYQDQNGVLETVFSDPSAPIAVGVAPLPPLAEPLVDSTQNSSAGQGMHLIRADLNFILAQIKIAEAHAAGVSLDDLLPNSRVPFGLRTVDGSFNNLTPGQTEFGAADTVFPRLTQPVFNSADPLPFDPDGPGPLQAGDITSYQQTAGLVFDSSPRTISNLIVDQTINNPAALQTAIEYAALGQADADALAAAEAAMNNAPAAATAAQAVEDAAIAASGAADANLAAAQAALVVAQGDAAAATTASNLADANLAAAQAALVVAQGNAAAATTASNSADAGLAAAQAFAALVQAAEDAAISASTAADQVAVGTAATLAIVDGTNPGGDATAAAQLAVDAATAAAAAAQAAEVAAGLTADASLIAAATAASDAADLALSGASAAFGIISGAIAGDSLVAAQAALAAANSAASSAQANEDAAVLASAAADAIAATAQGAATAAQVAEVSALATVVGAQTDVDGATTAASTAQGAEVAALLAVGTAQSIVNSAQTAAIDAQAAEVAAIAASGAADATATSLATAYTDLLTTLGILDPFGNVVLPNVAPDVGLSAPFNSWMTFFGQFFDHGLDLVTKGGNGTIFIPLQPDDPLYVEGGNTNFMVVTRATQVAGPGADGILGTADDTTHEAENTTSPFVDQNQTYSSHPSHQVFLRAYEINAAGDPVATGKLITNRNLGADGKFGTGDDVELGGMATWAVVKAQARDILGINLTDADVGNVPLLATDAYGKFIPGLNGFPQVVMTGDVLVEGNPAAPIDLTNALRTGHAFLNDIAHAAAPVFVTGVLAPDSDSAVGLSETGTYDNELLDAHYIAGDGRVNENIGLTAVHHIFHSEHNRLVEATKQTILLAEGDTPGYINDWLAAGFAFTPGMTADQVQWNGERLFQAAKFGTEMQYQHLVFEEFARTIQPNIDIFVGATQAYDINIDPSIVAEFAHTVYRFGHSMLTETIDRLSPTYASSEIGLIEAFLNPLAFAASGLTPDQAAGAIVRGVTRQVGNEIDEFVTDALRNNLVGLPLDLAAINLARGRDTGVPSLNAARREFYDATGDSRLAAYTSWTDFAEHLKHAASVINFIAAYGTHAALQAADVDTLADKRAVAVALVFGGTAVINAGTVDERIFTADDLDRAAFLNGTGIYASGPNGVTTTGVDDIDFWIGGLAEEKMPFGGMLGSTFNFVFEEQMEKLQNGDRFYYLERTAGLNFVAALENNSFAKMIMTNTDATHLPGLVFVTPAFTLEVDQSKQFTGLNEPGADGVQGTIDDVAGADGIFGNSDPVGGILLTPLVIRDNPNTVGPDSNYLQYTGDDHVVLGGTAGNDIMIASIGDDTVWGDGGNDRIEGGYGNDMLVGGAGDDIITDQGGDDNLQGGDGNDVLHGGNGLNLIIAGAGNDFVVTGEDSNESFGGTGNDFILGTNGDEQNMGGEGDDWLEGGALDGSPGDNFDPNGLDLIAGNDVYLGTGLPDIMNAEGGDDIMLGRGGPGDKYVGASGFDWASFAGDPFGVNIDLSVIAFNATPIPASQAAVLARFALVEGLSGSARSDILSGDEADAGQIAAAGTQGSTLTNFDLVSGLRSFVGSAAAGIDGLLGTADDAFNAGNIILGGDGSDHVMGRGGNDLIDGDKWLNVRISVRENRDGTGAEIASFDSMAPMVPLMLNGTYNPGQLVIVREVLPGAGGFNFDTAVFRGNRAEYTISTDVNGVTTVAHNLLDELGAIAIDGAGAGIDGTDRLTGIERLQFADQAQALVEGLNNSAAGLLRLNDSTPAVGQVLSVLADNVVDADNAATGGTLAGTIAYFWQVDPGTGVFEDIQVLAGGEMASVVGPNFTVTPDLEGQAIRVRAVYQDQHGVLETVFSAPTALVAAAGVGLANDFPVGTVLISDTTPTLSQLLTATDAFTDADGTVGAVITHQWQQASGGGVFTDIAGATGTSFTPGVDLVGALLRVVARYTDDQGTAEQVISSPTAPVNIVPTGTPLISDTTPTEDQVLTASPGTIADGNGIANAVFSYQWQAGDGVTFSNIAGATGASFAPGDAQVGLQLRVIASFTDDQGAVEQAASAATAAVVNVNDLPTGAPAISDTTPTEDQLLVASPGTIADADGTAGAVFTYQWQSGGGITFSDIAGATAASFAPGDAEVGRQLRVVATYTDNDGTVEQVVSAATSAVGNINDLATGAPAISDTTPTESQLLTATPGTVADIDGTTGAVFTYQWQAGDGTTFSDIVGASGANFTPTTNEVGLQLRVVASFTDDGGNNEQVVSAASAVVGQLVAGTAAEETLGGTTTADLLQGFAGNDVLLGGAGDDTLDGGVGDDWLSGGVGADLMMGGDGNDVFVVDDVLDSIVEGVGEGIDTVRANLASFTLGAGLENLVYTGTGSFAGTGNTLDNVLYGAGSGDTLSSLDGADSLMGLGGDDTLDGGVGDDWLNGGEGADVMIGGDGNDVFVVDDALDSVVEAGGQGVDVVMTTTSSYTLGGEIENLVFTGVGSFEGAGNALGNVLYGGAEADNLAGLAGADSLMGLDGNDTLVGGEGDDWLNGGVGIDNLIGGEGNDTYVVDDALDSITEAAGQGIDGVMATAGSYTLGAEVENLVFTGSGSFAGTGNALANAIYGGTDSDTLFGLGGVDSLLGQGGNDTLVGGTGDDWLTGGEGNDIFVFAAAGFGDDRIMDFDADPADGQDLLDVSGLGITAASFGTAVTILDVGADTLLNFAGGDSILLVGVGDATTVTSGDFLLAA